MKRHITLKHIAKELGVSIGTVSKALKNSGEISKDTKDKIKAFAKLYNYKPNNMAVNLKSQKTNTIGVIMPNVLDYFYATLLSGIVKFADQCSYKVLLCLSGDSLDKEIAVVQSLSNGSIDGFVVVSLAADGEKESIAHLKELTKQQMPLVLLAQERHEVLCTTVILDYEKIIFLFVTDLVAKCNSKVLLIMPEVLTPISVAVIKGYKKALNVAGIPFESSFVISGNYKLVTEKTRALIESNKIDVLFSLTNFFKVSRNSESAIVPLIFKKEIGVFTFVDGILYEEFLTKSKSIAPYGAHMGAQATKRVIAKAKQKEVEDSVFEKIAISSISDLNIEN